MAVTLQPPPPPGASGADKVPSVSESGLAIQDAPPLIDENAVIELNEDLIQDPRMTAFLPQIVKASHRYGYIRYGWALYHYMYSAVYGDPNTSQSKGGWEDIVLWGKQGGGKCARGDTKVTTPEGPKNIRELRVGDTVLGYEGNKPSWCNVTGTFTSKRPVVRVTTEKRKLYTSPEHAFFTILPSWMKKEPGFVKAWNLIEGTTLLNVDNDGKPGLEAFCHVERISDEETLYDISTTLGNYFAENVLVHNSNLSMQLMFILYQDWDWVLKRMILTARQVLDLYRETQAMQGRVPVIDLDDITTIFPKQLWFVSKEMYITLQQFIATIRMRFANIMSSTPLPQNLISSIKENVTFEVICYPQSSYMVERYSWLTDLQKPCVATLKKIYVEYSSFDIYEVPGDVWKEYEDRRWEVTEAIVSRMEETLKALDQAMGGRESDDEVVDAPDPEAYLHVSSVMSEMHWSPTKAMREIRKGYLRNVKFEGTYYVLKEDYDKAVKQLLVNDKTGGARVVALQ